MALTGLRSVELGVTDVAAAARFYTEVWGLTQVAASGDAVYLRGTGAPHHLVALHRRPRAELLGITFHAESRGDIDALHARLKRAEAGPVEPLAPIAEPGGGYGFAFKDPEGRIFRASTGDARHADAGDAHSRPRELAHVVLNSADVPRATAFFVDVLGFRLTDQTRMMDFVTCNEHHHNIAFAHADAATLNHIAFELPDLESLMRGAGRVRDAGVRIEWGVGRHGPGNNVFAYFVGPEDFVIEYTTEVARVDATYRVGRPEDWKWPPGRVDHWGISDPPSERMKTAQRKIRFADSIAPG
jgi:catechol 2,3-dioxygenase-like lactoylglutathione lyase family enzyme